MSAADERALLLGLIAALRRAFTDPAGANAAASAEIEHVDALISAATAAPRPLQPTHHPLTQHLPAVLDLADKSAPDTAAALRSLAARLPWRYGYEPRGDAPGLEGAMGWAELIGPLAPIVSHEVCFGLTLIGPRAHYLPHRHPAVELYRVVVGHPQWTVGSVTSLRAPGAAIFHDSNVVHAMRTEDEPLLAIYSWTGDIETPSIWA
ncbi:dimethylsulfonioproprionate lyase family protein [Rhodopseudomonas sp.]|uniref:dimethylsulfonioproprionate lyase family protein n=1 Tax=Rhodopseudomonas sp. TaxID=1078 RepID=UPI003B3B13FB